MSVISIFSGKYCKEKSIVEAITQDTGFKLYDDNKIIEIANRLTGIESHKLKQAFKDKISIFNKFTHDYEKSISCLKYALAKEISIHKSIFVGYCTHLIPRSISHVLKICIIADRNFRINQAIQTGKDIKQAEKEIKESDYRKAFWTNNILRVTDPWKSELYDILIPSDKMGIDEIIKIIKENIDSNVLQPTQLSLKVEKDFQLASLVEFELIKEGHIVDVSARDGSIILTINKNVLMLNKLNEELKEIVEKIEGVKSVETRVGKGYYKTDIYRRYDFALPQKVLLVDDEREFVQTLSERLLIKNIGSNVAYDGESAIEMINNDEPDVIVLDLKMPGIDGIEVLKRVKATKPNIEVIILTGHGSEIDKETCMNLGAFAYLQKPVNIQLLSETMKQAYEKAKRNVTNIK